jgi:hypothetical protein
LTVCACGCLQVCGDAEVWGDFIVPVPSAHLEGAVSDHCRCGLHSIGWL